MVPPDGGQAEGAVLGGVLLTSGPEEAQVDQPYRGGQDPVPVQAPGVQAGQHRLADPRQRTPEFQHPVELALVLLLPPLLVVQVLTPPGRVRPDRLDVPVSIRADPHLFPGGRYDQRFDPGQCGQVADRRGGRREIPDSPAAPAAADSRPGRIAARQLTRLICGSAHPDAFARLLLR